MRVPPPLVTHAAPPDSSGVARSSEHHSQDKVLSIRRNIYGIRERRVIDAFYPIGIRKIMGMSRRLHYDELQINLHCWKTNGGCSIDHGPIFKWKRSLGKTVGGNFRVNEPLRVSLTHVVNSSIKSWMMFSARQ